MGSQTRGWRGIGAAGSSGAAGKGGAAAAIGPTAGAAAGVVGGDGQPAGAVATASSGATPLGGGNDDGPRSPGTSNIAGGSPVSYAGRGVEGGGDGGHRLLHRGQPVRPNVVVHERLYLLVDQLARHRTVSGSRRDRLRRGQPFGTLGLAAVVDRHGGGDLLVDRMPQIVAQVR